MSIALLSALPSGFATSYRAFLASVGIDAVGLARVGESLTYRSLDGIALQSVPNLAYLARNASCRSHFDGLGVGDRPKTIVSCAVALDEMPDCAIAGGFARYCVCGDYHKVLRERLARLCDFLSDSIQLGAWRICIDTAPILEREWAVRAGMGHIGFNRMVIHPTLGSHIMLGEVLVEADLMPYRDILACETKPIVRTQMNDRTESIENVESIAQSELIEKVESSLQIELIAPSESIANVESNKKRELIEDVESNEAIELIVPRESIVNNESTEKVESSLEIELIAPSESIVKSESNKKRELIEDVKSNEAIESIAPRESMAKIESNERIELIEEVESIEERESNERIELIEKVESIAPRESIVKSESTEKVESSLEIELIVPSELIEKVESNKKRELIEDVESNEAIELIVPRESIVNNESTEKVESSLEIELIAPSESIVKSESNKKRELIEDVKSNEAIESIAPRESMAKIESNERIELIEEVESIEERESIVRIGGEQNSEFEDNIEEYLRYCTPGCMRCCKRGWRRCVASCPTGALSESGYDVSRCLSYWSTQHRGLVPEEMARAMGARLWGCDSCQTNCPWVRRAAPRPVGTTPLSELTLGDILTSSGKQLQKHLAQSPLGDAHPSMVVRNACIVVANTGNDAYRGELERLAQNHATDWVRHTALWALDFV